MPLTLQANKDMKGFFDYFFSAAYNTDCAFHCR